MIISKQPSTAVPLKLHHLFPGIRGVLGRGEIEAFESSFAEFNESKHAIAVGNGTTALYVLLLAMKELRPERDEVVLPAYTVPTLTLAFNSAGLKTVLCDVERYTLNMDPESMDSVVTEKTLAIIPVHMFGFPCTLEKALEAGKKHDVFVLEDACQAPGAKLHNKRVGSIGDAGIFSLCKGKNISTFHGGIVVTDNDVLAEKVRAIVQTLPPRELFYRLSVPAVLTAFSFAMRPWFYGAFYFSIARFKSTSVHEKFHPSVYNGFMAGVGKALLTNLAQWNADRISNGCTIMEGIQDDDGIILPRIITGAEPVFNHVPVVFHDPARLEETEKKLFKKGIDTGRMYEQPIHHIYDWLGYELEPEPFPEAAYIAPRLLTLPAHPYLTGKSIDTMIKVINSTG
ncbi:MAG: hypothetical protein HOC71_01580 [Candidatus Latescibacteria bacterium]|jgi:perosamine synthetase|nr:hypothetical protein [Candidatus Latescibacterota bacterium]